MEAVYGQIDAQAAAAPAPAAAPPVSTPVTPQAIVSTPNVHGAGAIPGSPEVGTSPSRGPKAAFTSAFTKPKAVLPPMYVLEYSDPDKVEGPSKHRYISTSFFVFRPASLPRRLCIYFIESKLFEPVILGTIFANCLTMAWESALDPPNTAKASFINVRRTSSPADVAPIARAAHAPHLAPRSLSARTLP